MTESYVVDALHQRILFRTAVLVMACDGEIHADEVRELKLASTSTKYFAGMDFDAEMCLVREQLEQDKIGTLRTHFRQLSERNFSPAASLQLLELVLRIIYADQRVHENEVRFCQLLQQVLRVPEAVIGKRFGSIPFLVGQSTSEKNINPATTLEFANRIAVPAQEDFHQFVDE